MSLEEQYAEIGRLLIEHANRQKEQAALNARLARIGRALQQAGAGLANAGAKGGSPNVMSAKSQLGDIASEFDVSTLMKLIEEHAQLEERLKQDLEVLGQYGVKE